MTLNLCHNILPQNQVQKQTSIQMEKAPAAIASCFLCQKLITAQEIVPDQSYGVLEHVIDRTIFQLVFLKLCERKSTYEKSTGLRLHY